MGVLKYYDGSSWQPIITGAQGVQGTTGLQGTQGTTGLQGFTGAQGTQGIQGSGYNIPTSTTSATIGLGSKGPFTVTLTGSYVVGDRVRVANTANTANYMEGAITALVANTSITVNVDNIGGTGTLASWNFGIAGIQGVQGVQGTQGITGLGYNGVTSATSNVIGTGTKTFSGITLTGAYVIGDYVRVVNTGSSTNYMIGTITALTNNSSITINSLYTGGTGTFTAWTFSIEGVQGMQGTTGLQGFFGLQGLQGTDGFQGLTGTQGLDGLYAAQGLQGTTGLQGISGTAGSTFDSITTSSGIATTATLWGDVTTGSITIGNSLTTGNILLGSITSNTGDIALRGANVSIGNASQNLLATNLIDVYIKPSGTGTTGIVTTDSSGKVIINNYIDTINASAATGINPSIYANTTTGNISIGDGLTTGQLNLATVGTGVTPIKIGHTNSTLTLGQFTTAGFIKTSAAGLVSVDTATYITGSSPTITTPVIASPQASSATSNTSTDLYNNVTSGYVRIGSGITSGRVNLAESTTFAGQINIASASTSAHTTNISTGATLNTVTKAVNIGTNGVAGSVTNITIGSATGTSTTNILGTGQVGGSAILTAASTASALTSFGTSPTLTTPIITQIDSSSATTGASLYPNNTSATINIAANTSFAGTVGIVPTSTSAHTISISNGAGTTNKTINIGTASTGGTTAIALGSSSGATSTIALNGKITLSAGTATAAPLNLTSGTNLTNAAAGAIEYDGNEAYLTTNTTHGRGGLATLTLASSTATKALTSATTANQPLFATPTTGALTVAAATSYLVDAFIILNTGTTNTRTTSFSLVGAGTATFTSAALETSYVGAISGTLAAPQNTWWTAATGGVMNATNTLAGSYFRVKGIIRVNASGTIIPAITFSAAPGGTNTVGINSFFTLTPIGSNTATTIGAWA
jgi:hypothetical protein